LHGLFKAPVDALLFLLIDFRIEAASGSWAVPHSGSPIHQEEVPHFQRVVTGIVEPTQTTAARP